MGDKEYRDGNGRYHRVGGPAIEFADGSKYWYQHGNLHRTGGPAVEYPEGSYSWIRHGRHHRLDGPSTVGAEGVYPAWYIKGKEYILPDYCTTIWNLITIKKASVASWRYLYKSMEG